MAEILFVQISTSLLLLSRRVVEKKPNLFSFINYVEELIFWTTYIALNVLYKKHIE